VHHPFRVMTLSGAWQPAHGTLMARRRARIWLGPWLAAMLAACGDGAGPEPPNPDPDTTATRNAAIAFTRSVERLDTNALVIVDLATRRERILDDQRLTGWIDWSPDGRYLALTGLYDWIRVLEPEGDVDARVYPRTGGFDTPRWSPDARRIAFRFQAPGSNGEIRVATLADGTSVDVSRDASRDAYAPDWSGDGTRVTYMAQNRTTFVWEIWVAAADGSARAQVPIPNQGHQPRWSPVADRLVYEAQGIWAVNPDGGNLAPLTPHCNDDGTCDREWEYHTPRWSPDGSRVVLVGGAAGESDLWLVNADGSDFHLLVRGGGDPQWSPEGDRVAYVAFAVTTAIFLVDPDGGTVTQLTDGLVRHDLPRWRPR